MSIRLSICIPTFNRADFIGAAITSALTQATDEVEVVVCDNASTDRTGEVVQALFAGRSNVRYFRWDRNMGADRNFLKVVEQATGEYCWLLGSDDILEPGSVGYVLSVLLESPGVSGLTVGRNAYRFDMTGKIWMPQARTVKLTGDTSFQNAQDAFVELGLYFGYLSAHVVCRRRWQAVATTSDLEPYMNAYVHIFVIAKVLQADPSWRYLVSQCVGWRSGNDSFLSAGLYNRVAIDVVGYEKITGDVFGRSSVPYKVVMAGVADVILPANLISAKLHDTEPDFYKKLFRLSVAHLWRYPVFWWRAVPLFLVPPSLILSARVVYRLTLKRWRFAGLR